MHWVMMPFFPIQQIENILISICLEPCVSVICCWSECRFRPVTESPLSRAERHFQFSATVAAVPVSCHEMTQTQEACLLGKISPLSHISFNRKTTLSRFWTEAAAASRTCAWGLVKNKTLPCPPQGQQWSSQALGSLFLSTILFCHGGIWLKCPITFVLFFSKEFNKLYWGINYIQ